MIRFDDILNFYKDKRVFITGNTGFKGSWLTHILLSAGAEVTGYALEPPTEPSLFYTTRLYPMDSSQEFNGLIQYYEDIRDTEKVKRVLHESQPEIVFHLAAQPIVRDSYKDPVGTYATNVMGTVNVCEAVRLTPSVRSFLNVTTDKVYKNNEWEYGYREDDPLDGYDPYSNSKSCSEMVTHSYKSSFFDELDIAVSTARAGNVIGGGDFSNDRIIPDCVRSIVKANQGEMDKGVIGIRNPYSTRPYQHVLEPLFMYLTIAKEQFEDGKYSGYYNVGPDDCDCVTTGNLVELFCEKWNKGRGSLPELSWENRAEENAPHEADLLKLDCSRIKSVFGWRPRWHIDEAIRQTVSWTRVLLESEGMTEEEMAKRIRAEMDREIKAFVNQ